MSPRAPGTCRGEDKDKDKDGRFKARRELCKYVGGQRGLPAKKCVSLSQLSVGHWHCVRNGGATSRVGQAWLLHCALLAVCCLYNRIPCAVFCCVVLYCTVPYCVLFVYSHTLCCVVLCCVVLYCAVLCVVCIIAYRVLCCVVLSCFALYCALFIYSHIEHCAVLCWVVC